MDKKNKKIVSNLVSRRGFPKYTENPSIGKAVSGTKTGVKRISNRTIEPNLYFLNVDYLFNGNRMAFIKEYRISELSEKKKLTPNQNEEESKTEIDKKTIDWIKELQ